MKLISYFIHFIVSKTAFCTYKICVIKLTNLNFDNFTVFWLFNKIKIYEGCLKSNETGSDSHLQ